MTHAGAGLTGPLWEAAALGSWGRLFPKGLTPQGQRVFSHCRLCILPPSLAKLAGSQRVAHGFCVSSPAELPGPDLKLVVGWGGEAFFSLFPRESKILLDFLQALG